MNEKQDTKIQNVIVMDENYTTKKYDDNKSQNSCHTVYRMPSHFIN